LIEDVRDALESALWYMRLEGGRYRFTTEPNLNKVVLEREGAIGDERIDALIHEALTKVAAGSPVLRVELRVANSSDLPDEPRLTLGVIDPDHRMSGDETSVTLRIAKEILERRGGAFRANKNAAMLVAADGPAAVKARASARTLAALRELSDDKHRLNRFNTEQREQLARRLDVAEERLPQQVGMMYRHLLLLGGNGDGTIDLDHIDLGPARVDARIGDRVLDYLRGADRLLERDLAPAALLAGRFGLLPSGTDAVELDMLLGYFARMPRLPKLADSGVLRRALADGVARGLFGLASGSSWDAEDAVLRLGDAVESSEIQFQPGTWLVRATAIRNLIEARHTPGTAPTAPAMAEVAASAADEAADTGAVGASAQISSRAATLPRVTVRVSDVPASQARELIKVAVLPLSAASTEVTIDVTIRANGGLAGIPRETLQLVVLEGLRQLGLHNVEVTED
jgi:hypothetical protein